MWNIELTDIFEEWFNQQSELIQNRILAGLSILEMNGPNAGRPHVDSIHGSKYTNMKELRIQHKGDPYRILFIFDPKRNGIILCAGNKKGKNKLFYNELISIAEIEYEKHINIMGF